MLKVIIINILIIAGMYLLCRDRKGDEAVTTALDGAIFWLAMIALGVFDAFYFGIKLLRHVLLT